MMQQYYRIKKQYPEEILFFRLGDFYEMFCEDAKKASKILGITLTHRNKIPMCGIPHQSKNTYLNKMLNSGLKIAICDQLDHSKKSKGIIERRVTQIITPGMILDDVLLDGLGVQGNNYIAALYRAQDSQKSEVGIAYIDVSTGDFYGSLFQESNWLDELMDQLCRIAPKELLVPELMKKDERFLRFLNRYQSHVLKSYLEESYFHSQMAHDRLLALFKVKTLQGYGLTKTPILIQVAGALVRYLQNHQMEELKQLKRIKILYKDRMLHLNESTIRHLELLEPQEDVSKKYTLFATLNQTKTLMGRRLLHRWILMPLIDVEDIQKRQMVVGFCVKNKQLIQDFQEFLGQVMDIERFSSRLILNRVSPPNLVSLKKTLLVVQKLVERIHSYPIFKTYIQSLIGFDEILDILTTSLEESPSIDFSDSVIKSGYNLELDRLRQVRETSAQDLLKLQESQRQLLKINNLKIKYNRILGYFVEISKASAKNIPKNYIAKQQLSNVTRYTFDELIDCEITLVHAQEKTQMLEKEIFQDIVCLLMQYTEKLRHLSDALSEIDVLLGFSFLSLERQYVCPEVYEGPELIIEEGRHPVIEWFVDNNDFISNSTFFSDTGIQLLFGPNMSGKSTYLRQVALLVIMAQIGCFIPAKKAKIGLIYRIFTRIGASDYLAKGQSTFLVEMVETAYILNHTTEKSLIIMDEIGRGTSTYDGLAIAWSILEYLSQKEKGVGRGKVLFATHHHELMDVSLQKLNIKNYHVSVQESEGEILFLYKVKPGASSHSYGIQVASLAGLPDWVIARSKIILQNLQADKENKTIVKDPNTETVSSQLPLFNSEYLYQFLASELLNLDLTQPKENLISKIKHIQKIVKSNF